MPCFLLDGAHGGDVRQTNLGLLQQYGSNAWRIHNYLNEASAKDVEQALEGLKNLTTGVNRDRKNEQVGTGPGLRSRAAILTSVWYGSRRGWEHS